MVDRQESGRPGSWVLTALLVDGADGAVVPVVRGWLPAGEPGPAAPGGQQKIVGWLEPTESDALRERGRDPLPEGQVEIVSSAELLSLWKPPLFQGFVIQQQPEPEPPLVDGGATVVDDRRVGRLAERRLRDPVVAVRALRDLLVRSNDAGGAGGPGSRAPRCRSPTHLTPWRPRTSTDPRRDSAWLRARLPSRSRPRARR